MGITRDFANIIRSNGDIVISGDLDVNGTQTTINTTTFVVEDKNIELGANATSNSQNDGAGISILLPDASPDEFATLTYVNSSDAWSFNKKVGIGTTSPNVNLEVQGSSASTYSGSGPGATIIASQGTDGNWIASNVDGKFAYFGIDGNDGKFAAYNYATNTEMGMVLGQSRMVIKGDGNVGIGADNPNAKLHVIRTTTDGAQRTIYADGNQLSEISSSGTNYLHNVWIENRNFDINSGVTDSGYRIGLNIEGYHDSNVFEGTLATQKNIWSRVGNNTGGTGTITDLYNMHLETLSGGGLTITNNWGLYQSGSGTKNYFEGSVGIGTTSPFAKLSVTGASASANDSGIFQITDGTGANTDTKITMGVVSSDYGWIQAVKPGTDVFDLVLNPNGGNVGIGTESPRRKLEVYGAAGANVLQSQDSADSTNFLRMYSDVANGSAINVNTGGIIRFAHSDESFANFVERMTIDADGNLLVRQTSAVVRDTNTAGDVQTFWGNQFSSSSATTSKVMIGSGSSEGYVGMSRVNTDSKYIINSYIRFDNDGFTAGSEAGFMSFYTQSGGTNAAERMRIDASGFTKAKANGGNSFTGAYHELVNNNNTSGQRCLVIGNNAGSATNNTSSITLSVSDAVADRLFIYGNGDVVNLNNSYGALSDVKLKENIVDASPKLEGLLEIKVRNYNLIGETNKQIGVIAQELEQIFPSMVSETPDRDIDGNDIGTVTKSVKYSVFVPMLIKAIQEQQATIEALTARIAALES